MQTLKDSELRYRRLFEAAQDGILILDDETGAITDINPFLVNMLGYSREEFLKRKLWEVVSAPKSSERHGYVWVRAMPAAPLWSVNLSKSPIELMSQTTHY
jgi:PAS domain S-box-containing protein